MSNNAPSSGLAPNVAAGLAYLFGILGGIIFILLEKSNYFVRFAAIQSIVFCAAYIVVRIVLTVLMSLYIPGVTFLLAILSMLIGLGFFILWIYLFIRAFQGIEVRLPIIGDIAAKYV